MIKSIQSTTHTKTVTTVTLTTADILALLQDQPKGSTVRVVATTDTGFADAVESISITYTQEEWGGTPRQEVTAPTPVTTDVLRHNLLVCAAEWARGALALGVDDGVIRADRMRRTFLPAFESTFPFGDDQDWEDFVDDVLTRAKAGLS